MAANGNDHFHDTVQPFLNGFATLGISGIDNRSPTDELSPDTYSNINP